MEVMKVYSEVDTNERLYSVLMGEDELRIFQKMFTNPYLKNMTPEEKRSWRLKNSMLDETGTVNDSINAKGATRKNVGLSGELSLAEKSATNNSYGKKNGGYSNEEVRQIQQGTLDEFKDQKTTKSGRVRNADKRLERTRFEISGTNLGVDGVNSRRRREILETQEKSKRKQTQYDKQKAAKLEAEAKTAVPQTTTTPQVPQQQTSTQPKPQTQSPTSVPSTSTSSNAVKEEAATATKNTAGKGFMNTAKKFVSKHKKSLGIGAAGTLALGTSAYLYKRKKKEKW